MSDEHQAPPAPAWRRAIVMLALLALPLALLARAVSLQVLEGDFLQGQGDQRHLRVEQLSAHRGGVYDRHGRPLSISAPVESIWVDPGMLLNASAGGAIERIAEVLGRDPVALRQEIAARAEREFHYLRRHVDPAVAERVAALDRPGVYLRREYRRFYPAGEVTGHVLGFTDIDDRGQEGLELAYDDWLAGQPGAKRVLRDRLGRNIEDVERLREPQPGRDLTLTLDKRLQYIAYRELKGAVERFDAAGGSVVLLDPDSGEILAMVNQPAFNPNRRSDITGGRYRNRAVTDVYEPGSVIKPFTIAAALAAGAVTPETRVQTSPGVIRVAGEQVEDIRDFGELTVTGVLKKSSNVGAVDIAMGLEPGTLWRQLNELAFGRPTGVAFPGEAAGHLSAMPSRRPFERATLAFGYGLSATSLQLARAYAAIAADGRLPVPRLIKGQPAEPAQQAMPPDLAATLREMLTSVTRAGGTATSAAIPGYEVAGKTGTSRKAVAGGYAADRYVSTFAGMAPADDPRFVAVVTIDEPGGEDYYAGIVAAPVFQSLMSSALRLHNIPPEAAPDDQALTVARGGNR
jgi:cell division protein FtsI (penicillin-binding protein 3)